MCNYSISFIFWCWKLSVCDFVHLSPVTCHLWFVTCHSLPVHRAVDEYDPAAESETGAKLPEEYVLSVFISILKFFGIFIGSFLLGVAMAMITALVMKMSKLREHPLLETSMFIILSYSTFVIAEAAGLTGTCVCAYVYVCLYVCMYVCVCMYIVHIYACG